MKKKRVKYQKDRPHRLYAFFIGQRDSTIPSFSKFAVSIGACLEDVKEWRKYREFDRAWRECSEIRRDYLIDAALTRRLDGSFAKFLLTEEVSAYPEESGGIDFTLRVVDE